jgi:hypothetical protein
MRCMSYLAGTSSGTGSVCPLPKMQSKSTWQTSQVAPRSMMLSMCRSPSPIM